jgi:hypothetical protein
MVIADPVTIALAAVKLAMSAADHYITAANCITRYRKYNREIKEIVKTINVHQAIFRNATRALLLPYVDIDEALQMVNDTDHANWSNPSLKAYVSERVTGSGEGMRNAVSLITSNLQALKRLGEACGFIVKDMDVVFGAYYYSLPSSRSDSM